jgi:hypothetical protein
METLIGRTLGHYRILNKIGAGGMGEVYRARDERLGRDVAIKVLPEEVSKDPDRARRFEREARAVAALSHPSILEIFDFDTDGDVTYAVTEFLEGEDLHQHLSHEEGPLPWLRVQEIGTAVASGLSAAHGRGVVHRDIKPSNLFLCGDGRIKILDFGLAAVRPGLETEAQTESLEAPLTLEGKVLGTVGYMAPEQVRGRPADHRSDIFSFGCVLYEMVTGQRAFQRETAADTLSAILSHDPPPLSESRRDLPSALQELVDGCLAKRPEDRFPSMEEVLRSMQTITGPGVSGPRGSSAPRAKEGGSRLLAVLRKPAVVLPLLAVLVVAAIVAGRALRRRSADAWAREQAIPEILRLADEDKTLQALMLAPQVEERLPDSGLLDGVWDTISEQVEWQVTPEGAAIFARSATGPDTGWLRLGSSGNGAIRSPKGFWLYRFEAPAHEPIEVGLVDRLVKFVSFDLPAEGEIPEGMVRIDRGGRTVDFWLNYINHEHLRAAAMESYLIDRFEVTRPAGPGDMGGRDLPRWVRQSPGRWCQLVRSRGLRGVRRQAASDRVPLGGGEHAKVRADHPLQQLLRQPRGGGELQRQSDSFRPVRHTRQCQGMVLERNRGAALHARRGVRRAGLSLPLPGAQAAVRPQPHQRLPLHEAAR